MYAQRWVVKWRQRDRLSFRHSCNWSFVFARFSHSSELFTRPLTIYYIHVLLFFFYHRLFCFLLKSISSTTSGVFAKANRIDRKPRHPAVNGDINFKEYPDPSQNNEEKLWLVYNYNYFPPSSKVLFVYFFAFTLELNIHFSVSVAGCK